MTCTQYIQCKELDHRDFYQGIRAFSVRPCQGRSGLARRAHSFRIRLLRPGEHKVTHIGRKA